MDEDIKSMLKATLQDAYSKTTKDAFDLSIVLQEAFCKWALGKRDHLQVGDFAIATARGFALAIGGAATNLAANGVDMNGVKAFVQLMGIEAVRYCESGIIQKSLEDPQILSQVTDEASLKAAVEDDRKAGEALRHLPQDGKTTVH